jgi:hypothetical protein
LRIVTLTFRAVTAVMVAYARNTPLFFRDFAAA